MNVVTTGQGNHLIRINNAHGAPHVFFDMYDVYVADGKVVAEGHFGTAFNYYSTENPVISANGMKVVISNNTNAVIYDDATLKPVAYYNLIEMLGIDPGLDEHFDAADMAEKTFYDVVAYGENYLIAKSGLSKRIALVNLDTGKVIWLYKVIYSDARWIEYIENDYSFTEAYGDLVNFAGEKDGQLLFEGKELQTNVEFSYDLNRK